ncbi:hypothetical protein WK11_28650 [Burkholderia ubonensis]|uniref:RND transporter n=2 Tax=Burkholderia ubonensis TaxID=101571 RepID=A0ABD4E9W1_9BURK|nr:hypothetical protein WJ68_33860 [Burkholderia ubonensis]KVN94466.1 hypothetical protein WJ71_33505 [Burkholderia ubonensis]KVO15944.1 hypothetical protein WJ72_10445 [Burkholderia ubonensis]KVO74354.1 hypothetical protein WJ80_29315 [Burkholderia ubonensis]KVR15254.1 hypothetical protein WK11_28650 [Burkholderia ubonensis]
MMSMRAASGAVLLATVVLAGCNPLLQQRSVKDIALTGDYMGVHPSETLDSGAGARQTYANGAAVPGKWWTRFGSPSLDRVIETAMRDSPSLRSTESKLVAAQKYLIAQQGASYFPSIDFNASVKREKVNTASIGLPILPNPKPFTLYNTGLSISYDFDVFGAERHLVASKRHEVEAKTYQLEAARLALAGNIVTAAVREAQLRSEIGVRERLRNDQRRVGQVLNGRYANGSVGHDDVLDSEADVARSEAELLPLRKSLAQVRMQLAVYAGASSPESVPEFHLEELHLPEQLPLVVPSEWVHRRPDILAAEANLRVAGELAGVAAANLYPQIALSANIGSSPLTLARLFAGDTGLWSFGAQLTAPIFRGGELNAKRDAAYAEYEAAFQDYKGVVLTALQSVGDAMAAMEQDSRASAAYIESARRREALRDLTLSQLGLGNRDLLDVLQAERAYNLSELDVVRARASQLTNTAAFFSAMGGAIDLPSR